MKNKFHVNNAKVFILFALIVIVIVGLFIFFILKFNNLDDNKYPIKEGSSFYNDDYNYLKVEHDSYLAQRFDGNYYWYQKENNRTVKEKIGSNPVVYSKNDYKVYLFGNAYQVKNNGEVVTLSGMTEIVKASPTKFYKLRDRKYLMVDSSIKTNDGSVKTSGYLIIELDKQGNATFANNEVNVKTIKPLVLKGTTMSFDIANEKLIYGKKEINLKNIIGSTNNYKATSSDNKTNITSLSGSPQDETSSEGYYDEYVKDVIYSVNNLTKSVTDVNDKADTSVKKGEIYYDFSKYLALKSVSSSITTITINYTVVDSNNEYQNIFVVLDDNKGNTSRYYLNKNETNYVLRNLLIDHNYTLSFGYKLVGSNDEVIDDVVNVKTKAPSCKVSVLRVSNNKLDYNVKISSEYKFDSGIIHLYTDGASSSSQDVNMNTASSNSGYNGTLSYSRLGSVNTLKLENLVYNGNGVSLDCSFRFVS